MATSADATGAADTSDILDAADQRVPGVAGSVQPFPPLQHMATDWMALAHRRHIMHGLFEVDVTEARRAIRAYRAHTGAPLSLTTFLAYCLACAVDADKAMHAYRLGRRRQDDVEVRYGAQSATLHRRQR